MSRKLAYGKRLADKQTIQNWIAESRAEINASRLLVLDAAKKIDNEGAYASKVEISTIKFYVAQVLQNVLDRAVQVHGALGMTDDTPLASLYRHERSARIYDGADEVHKSRVAKEIMKKYLPVVLSTLSLMHAQSHWQTAIFSDDIWKYVVPVPIACLEGSFFL